MQKQEELRSLHDLTAARVGRDGTPYVSNPDRGALLYTILKGVEPERVLEIGTGRGYGALAMAMAIRDHHLSAVIDTVDAISPSNSQPWPMIREGEFSEEYRSIVDVWNEFADDLRRPIRHLTGKSTEVVSHLVGNGDIRYDFFFIDGAHNFASVRHDLFGSMLVATQANATVLFDDYGGEQGKGVVRLLDLLRRRGADIQILRMTEGLALDHPDQGHHMALWTGKPDQIIDMLRPSYLPESIAYVVYRRLAIIHDWVLGMRSWAGRNRRLIMARLSTLTGTMVSQR